MALLDNYDLKLYEDDLSSALAARIAAAGVVAWDIETSGLHWESDRLATCQLYSPGCPAAVVRVSERRPEHLIAILEDPHIQKIHHFAVFDLRFMVHSWAVSPRNVVCTKIASKLLDKDRPEGHTLRSLVRQYLDVELDKSAATSDWFAATLTDTQLAYAIGDVIYLPQLFRLLEAELLMRDLLPLARACFEHVPARVALEVLGYPDVYTY